MKFMDVPLILGTNTDARKTGTIPTNACNQMINDN